MEVVRVSERRPNPVTKVLGVRPKGDLRKEDGFADARLIVRATKPWGERCLGLSKSHPFARR